MSGSPQRRRARCEEDISGQFRVTVPDAGELDQLRTRGGVYQRGLYTLGNRDNAPPERTQSLPASSCESSTEPMDTDDVRRASEEIYRRIRQQAQTQSLFRPPMSDPELDLERQRGARPKVVGPLTTHTIQEEARAAPTEKRALEVRGTDFYLPLGGSTGFLKGSPGELL